MSLTTTTINTASGVRLCYDVTGDPSDPPLLLLQGLSAQLVGWHPALTSALADAGFYVIRQDNRDVGHSQKFDGTPYTLADMARDSAELLEALDLAPAHVVGQSMGGMIAQEMALNHPGSVRSLALLYTCARPEHIQIGTVDKRRTDVRASSRAEAVEEYLLNEEPCAGAGYPPDEAWLRELGGIMYDRDYDPEAAERQFAAITASGDRTARVPKIAAPTTLIHGDADRLVSIEGSRELHRLIDGATLTVHPGMGHAIPAALWPSIISQIARNTLRGLERRAVSAVTARV